MYPKKNDANEKLIEAIMEQMIHPFESQKFYKIKLDHNLTAKLFFGLDVELVSSFWLSDPFGSIETVLQIYDFYLYSNYFRRLNYSKSKS